MYATIQRLTATLALRGKAAQMLHVLLAHTSSSTDRRLVLLLLLALLLLPLLPLLPLLLVTSSADCPAGGFLRSPKNERHPCQA
jgi:hypothetical protein